MAKAPRMMTTSDEGLLESSAFVSESGTTIPASQTPIQEGPGEVAKDDVGSALDEHVRAAGVEVDTPATAPTDTEETAQPTVPDAQTALDDLFKEAVKEATPEPEKPAPVQEKPAAPAEEKPVPSTEDPLDKIQLPPNVSQKAADSFKEVKRLARERQEALLKELEEAKKQIVPKEKVLTEEVEKELTDLRHLRSSLDYQNSDEFRTKFGEPLAKAETEIFDRLKAANVKDDGIAKIKEIGLDKLDWDGLLSSLPGNHKIALQALLVERERISMAADKAVKEVKATPAEFAKRQAEKVQQEAAEKEKAATQEFESTTGMFLTPDKAPWFHLLEVPADASEEKRAEILEHNAFAQSQREMFSRLKADNSPGTRASLIAGVLLALQQKKQLAKLEQRAKEAEETIERIRKSSGSARQRLTSPVGAPAIKEAGLFDRVEDSLDRLRDEVISASN